MRRPRPPARCVDVLDHDPIVPHLHRRRQLRDEEAVGGWRDDIAPLDIVQPDGPGFTLDGHVLRWQDWRLHVALHPIDGLVLSGPALPRRREDRQVLHRAAPQRDGRPVRRPGTTASTGAAYFDAGEYGMGRLANSLQLGCDCLGEIRYVDAVLADGARRRRARSPTRSASTRRTPASSGSTRTRSSGRRDVRRSRRLVVSFFATVGNYDYGFYWSLYQDGTIELEAKLTGIVLTRGVTPGQELRAARRASPPTSPRRTTSTCSTSGWTWRSTASRTRSTRSTSSAPTSARRTRTGRRSSPARRRSARVARAGATSTGRGALVEGRQPGRDERRRRADRLQAAALQRADDARGGPSRASGAARASRARTSG